VYYTYKLLVGKVDGKESINKIPKGNYTWVYHFGQNDESVYIMWYDNPLGGSKEVEIPLPWENVLVTHVITEPGVTEPVTEIKSTQNGFLHIILDGSPIFVEKY
jgi:hypothetical protein